MENQKLTNAKGLRMYVVKLDVSGATLVAKPTKLYQSSYGFVGLRCLVPVTVNNAGSDKFICTVQKSEILSIGTLKQDPVAYNMLYVGKVIIANDEYYCFETPLPKAFTDVEANSTIRFYFTFFGGIDDTMKDAEGKVTASSVLASGVVEDTIYSGGPLPASIELGEDFGAPAEVTALKLAYDELIDDLNTFKDSFDVDSSSANQVGDASVLLEPNENGSYTFVFKDLKGERGEPGPQGPTGGAGELVQDLGERTDAVVSQKTITDEFTKTNSQIETVQACCDATARTTEILKNALIDKDIIAISTIDERYNTRITANDANIVSEQTTQVLQIQGNTVVKNTTVNLLNLGYSSIYYADNWNNVFGADRIVGFYQESSGTVGMLVPYDETDVVGVSIVSKNSVVLQPGTYTLTGYPSGLPKNNGSIALSLDASGIGSTPIAIDSGEGCVFTLLAKTMLYVVITINKAVKYDYASEGYWKPMVAKGDTIPVEFSSYVAPELVNSRMSGIKSTTTNLLTSDVYSLSSWLTNPSWYSVAGVLYKLPTLANKTYTVKFDLIEPPPSSLHLRLVKKVETGVQIHKFVDGEIVNDNLFSFTAEEGAEYYVYSSNTSIAKVFTRIQLNLGSYTADTVPEYVDYAEDTFALGETLELSEWDYIDVEGKKYVRQTQELVFDGSEDEPWKYQDKFSELTLGFNTYNSKLPVAKSMNVVTTDHVYLWSATGGTDTNGYTGISVRGTTRIPIPKSAEALKWWLSVNPVKLVYQAFKPIEEIDLNLARDYYKAWRKGSETIEGNDNAEYGAEPKVAQKYVILG